MSASSRRAGCASNRPVSFKNPAGPSTFRAPTVMASSCSSPTCASNGPAPRGSNLHRETDDQPARSVRWSGGSCHCSSLTLTATVVRERALTADSDLTRYCAGVVRDHAGRHGWSKRQTNDVIRSLRLLQVLQDTPGAKIHASEVAQLPRYDGNINSTLDVLAAAGLLIDDRVSHVERYFAAKTARCPSR